MTDFDSERPVPTPGRRALLQGSLAGLGGLTVAGMLPGLTPTAEAAKPADPNAGPPVRVDPVKKKSNPIVNQIQKSGVKVRLVDFCAPPRSAAAKPYAQLNYLYHAGDGQPYVYCCDSRGKIWRIHRDTGATSLFLDVKAVRGAAIETSNRHKGLRSFAFHPEWKTSGKPGYRKFYTVSTETVGSAPSGVEVFKGDFPIQSHCVVAEWQVRAGDPTQVDTSTRRELFRIATSGPHHNADTLLFDPNAKSGDDNYGKLFLTVGDGGYGDGRDKYNSAQNTGRLLGKILRFNPTDTSGGKRYGIPSTNPFVGRSGWLPHIWALGVRHPQNITFDRGGNKQLICFDIGQAQIEEVNLIVKGGNYGWPLREGIWVTDRNNGLILYELPPNDASKNFLYPVAMYDHNDGAAGCGGHVYRGSRIPALNGHYLCGDLWNGRIYHVPAGDLVLGRQATLKELTLYYNGKQSTLREIVQGVNNRVDLRIGTDEAGDIYILTKQDGKIRKLVAY